MTEPYRATYRVERTTREPTPRELALVEARRAAYHAEACRRVLGSTNEALVPAGVAVVVGGVGARIGNTAVTVAGALMALMFGAIFVLARRRAKARLAAERSPWDAPEGGWKIEETRVLARSVVVAVSDDEDYAFSWLFEVPGGDWFVIDPELLQAVDGAEGRDLARAELRLVRLSPDGRYLGAEAAGEPIPRHGAAETAEGYAAASLAGQVFRPEDVAGPWGLVPERDVPAWARALVA